MTFDICYRFSFMKPYYQDRLTFALLEISCFPMTDQSSVLVTVKRGWDGENVFQFLKDHQSQFVAEVKWQDRVETTTSEGRIANE